MRRTGVVKWQHRHNNILGGRSEGKKTRGRPRCRWEEY
jgi:hypothetical protein